MVAFGRVQLGDVRQGGAFQSDGHVAIGPFGGNFEAAAVAERGAGEGFCQSLLFDAIFESFALADAQQAHELMESSEHMGKIVLSLD